MNDCTTTVEHDGHTLAITTEQIRVDSYSEPDPHWSAEDDQGHHHWAQGNEDTVGYPTLHHVPHHGCADEGEDVDPDFCDYDGDQDLCYPVLGCRRCGQRMVPGSRTGRTRFIKGLTSYMIDGRHVDEATARAFADTYQRALNARANDRLLP